MTTPLKQPHIERRIFQQRIWVAVLLVSLAFAALIARYFYLQVIQHTYYSQQAEKNRFKNSRIKATRGLIYDRNGTLLADNVTAYRLLDRKSTRLNSSHVKISYAVVSLKKKKHLYE